MPGRGEDQSDIVFRTNTGELPQFHVPITLGRVCAPVNFYHFRSHKWSVIEFGGKASELGPSVIYLFFCNCTLFLDLLS